MSSQITGILVQKLELKKISDSFSAQEFVIKTDGQYPQEIVLQASNKSLEWLNKAEVGNTITVDFDIRGKRFSPPTGNDKFFNTLSAYKIAVLTTGGTQYAQSNDAPKMTNAPKINTDLPF